MGDIKCTLTDEQLIEACDKWVSKFCESGGKAWTLQVPVNMNEDPDMLLTELANRFKQRLSFQPASVEEAAHKYAVGFNLPGTGGYKIKVDAFIAGAQLVNQKSNIDWDKLRNDFFITHTEPREGIPKISSMPHAIFDWFKQRIG